MKLLSFIIVFTFALSANSQTIYEIQGQAAHSPYDGQEVSTKGIVTAVYGNSYFIQDGDSAWTGLYIYDQNNVPALGDSLELIGTIDEYFDFTELVNVTSFNVSSSGNTIPEPIIIETGDNQEKWESVFLQVNNAECTNPDLGYGEWEINDGTGAIVINDLGIAYTPIAGVKYKVTGPLSYSFEKYKLEPRGEDDIFQDLALYFKTNPVASAIEQNSFDLIWETNDTASAYVEYGLTTDFELGKAFSTVSSTTHTVTLNELNSAEIYYTNIYSVNANMDTTPIYNGVYATQSKSSGVINSYFTYEPIITKKSIPTEDIINTIMGYIEKAEASLDIAIYDMTNHAAQSDSSNYEIIRTINKAHDNGIQVRLITDGKVANYALDSLNQDIPVLKRNSDGIMHHKFIVIDAESVNNSWVFTGSTNWNYNNLFLDFNNAISIQDQSLAKAYTLEFNEMWGSADAIPNEENAKFGKDKMDNTPHQFNINDVPVELYFSPSDKTTSKIASAIDNAKESVDFAMMVFTENSLGTAMVNAQKRGVNTYGYIDYVEYTGSEYDYLLANDVEVIDFVNPEGGSWPDAPTLHHKYCIVDKSGDNPITITGTHNWSASAESKNDENTLFIFDEYTTEMYSGHMYAIQQYIPVEVSIQNESFEKLSIYPNPSTGTFTIKMPKQGSYSIEIYDILGQKVEAFELIEGSKTIALDKKGVYIVVAKDDNSISTQKITIQ